MPFGPSNPVSGLPLASSSSQGVGYVFFNNKIPSLTCCLAPQPVSYLPPTGPATPIALLPIPGSGQYTGESWMDFVT
jgi:hypothetical protein